MKYKFPENFWWGAASSGPQSEGSADKTNDSVMDYWYKESPNEFFDKVGPTITNDFYHRYKEDIKLFKEIGFNSYRTSIQWTRLIDDLEEVTVNEKAVEYYHDLFKTCKENGIEIIVNLSHFDMPIELQEKYGGWESRHVVDLFSKYASKAFELFNEDVNYWCVINEPMVVPEAGYLYGWHYPKYENEGKKALQVMYNIIIATAKTIQVYKENNYDGQIGTILNLTPAYPASDSLEDIKAASFVDDFFNNMFVDAAVKGELPKQIVEIAQKDNVMWYSEDSDEELLKNNTIDFLGVNYYHPKRVKARSSKWNDNDNWMPDKYFEEYDWPEKRINPYRGWEIYPKAIYDIAIKMRDKYPNTPWFVSENGMGVENEERFMDENNYVSDDYRIEFYEEHLAYLHQAIQEGSNCIGFHAWTAVDNWSWNNAYKNRYGYISLDLKTQKRTIKKSGYWLKKVSERNGF